MGNVASKVNEDDKIVMRGANASGIANEPWIKWSSMKHQISDYSRRQRHKYP